MSSVLFQQYLQAADDAMRMKHYVEAACMFRMARVSANSEEEILCTLHGLAEACAQNKEFEKSETALRDAAAIERARFGVASKEHLQVIRRLAKLMAKAQAHQASSAYLKKKEQDTPRPKRSKLG